MICFKTLFPAHILRSSCRFSYPNGHCLIFTTNIRQKAQNANLGGIPAGNFVNKGGDFARHYSTQQHVPELRFSKRKKQIGPLAWFLLMVPIATFGLGTWQVKRKKWKEDLIESLMVKTKLPAVPLPEMDSDVRDMEYRVVRVKGKFDHSGEMYLGPRSCLVDGQSLANEGRLISQSANGIAGYLVVTPFQLSDSSGRILVNRGWVPFKQKNAKTRPKGQIEGEVELEGIVRLTESRPPFGLKNKPDARIWFSRDVEAMAEMVDTRPVFIDAKAESTVAGGPIGGQTRASLRNEHFSYILTWYSLSAATAVMWYVRYLK